MSGIQRQIRNADALPRFELNPEAYRIGCDAEALAIARQLAGEFAADAMERDRERRSLAVDRFSGSGLWAITVPKAYGGADVSMATVAEVIAIISAADPSLGQLPQSHFSALDVIRVTATEEQKRLWFGRVLQGYRFGCAFLETTSKRVDTFQAKLKPIGGGYALSAQNVDIDAGLFADFIQIEASDEKGNAFVAMLPRGASGLAIVGDWSGPGQRTPGSCKVMIGNVRVGPEAVIPIDAKRPRSNGSLPQIIQAAVEAGIARGAIEAAITLVRKHGMPWIDSRQENGCEDVFTIAQIGDLEVKLHAAEALLARAGRSIDGILNEPSVEAVSEVAVKIAEAKVLTTEIAVLAINKFHELDATDATLDELNLGRHWRNAVAHRRRAPVRWECFDVGNHLLNGIEPPRHAC